MKRNKIMLTTALALTTALMFTGCGSSSNDSSSSTTSSSSGSTETTGGVSSNDPVDITIFYSDNPTLPYLSSWYTVNTTAEIAGANVTVEAIPSTDFNTKVSLALNTGTNAPDVILYCNTSGEFGTLALNGAVVPISDYPEYTPNFNAMVESFGLEENVDSLNLLDGKRYYMPQLFDQPFYDGGLIMRQDYLDEKGFDAPETFDDLYEILLAYKQDFPNSYPLTHLAAPYVTYRMTMPSFGVAFGQSSSASRALSYNFDTGEYFAGAISDEAREYLTYMNKLYSAGLIDPEMAAPIDGDVWASKLSTGASMASYAYYDQIPGLEQASEIEGFDMQMYAPLEGPAGAYHQYKASTGRGILFPAATAERDDFEELVRAIDTMFFSEECATIWCLGEEGNTYTMDGNQIVYSDEILNSADGIYKTLQVQYGCGADPLQLVWVNEREMSKYDEYYAEINATVSEMNAIQPIPPTPLFDDWTSEEASMIQSPLADSIEKWIDAFITGAKSLETDWDEYVAEMESLNINTFLELYNDNLAN